MNCPQCQSSDTRFREKRNEWICEECDHRWEDAAETALIETQAPKEEAPKTRIFLSYSRGDDEPFVRRLGEDLTAAGFTVWFDRQSLMSRGLTFHQEIKDAIRTEVDRVIYVGGPQAALSPYVREEWQFALECDHVVVIPILRLGDYDQIPGELGLLHCEDFREDVQNPAAQYSAALAKLLTSLRQPNPQLGALLAVPTLPPHFLARRELMCRVRDALLVDLQKPQVISSDDARVGMQGMGGIGKSVLAAALARNRQVRQSYPDGIVWISCGQNLTADAQLSRLRDLVRMLGGEDTFQSVPQGQGVLRVLLQAKAVLLVLDDVWQASDAQTFDFLGPRCRMLVTTRDAGILHTLHGELVLVSLFTEAEALQLLADAVGVACAALPAEAQEVVRECGLLPLALALSGGMAKKHGGHFHSVLERLRRADLEKIADRQSINEDHRSIWRAMQASVEMLSDDEQRRFAELVVFSADETVPEAALATLWAHTGNLDDRDTEDLLINLAERSLIQVDQKSGTDGRTQRRISLHDLLYDYATRIAGQPRALHQTLLDAYQKKCPTGWHEGPNDGYFFEHLVDHMLELEDWDELEQLLCDLRFIEAKCTAGLTFDLVRDYKLALEAHPDLKPEREAEQARERRLQEYGAQLIEYAQTRGEDVVLPEPPDTRPTQESMRRAEAVSLASPASGPANVELSRSARIGTFGNFVSSHSHQLGRFPDQTLPTGFNHASDGPVVEQAGRLADSRKTTWLRLAPRPPTPPKKPVCLRTLEGHSSRVTAVALTPDGNTAISGSVDKTLRVWDVATGELLRTLAGHTKRVHAVALTPDGNTAVSGSWDNTLRVWDVATGELLRTLAGHTHSVTAVALTPDGNTAVSCSDDKTLRVWNVATGELLRTLAGHTKRGDAVALTPDGNTAVSGSWDNTLRVWDVATGELLRTLEGHTDRVHAVALTPDGNTAVSGSWDNTLRVWDVATGELLRTLEGHTDWVNAVALTPDGNTAISGSGDKTLRVWDVATGELLRTLAGHTNWVNAVALTPDGNTAVSGSGDLLGIEDNTLRVWDVAMGELLRTLEGHTDWVNAVALTPDGNTAVSCSVDKTLHVWDVATGELLRTLAGHTNWVHAVALTPDGNTAVSCSEDKTLHVWDVATGELLRTLAGHTNWVHAVALTPDGNTAVSCSEDNTLRVWDVATGELLRTLEGHTDRVHAVALTPDGNTAVSCSVDKTLRVWDVATGELLRTLAGHRDGVHAVALTPDGNTAVSADSGDFTLRVWDVATGELLRTLAGHTHLVRAVALTPDGNTAVSGSWDNTLRVWDVATGELLRTLAGHTHLVRAVALTPDGHTAVSCSDDNTLRVWDVATGELVAVHLLEVSGSSVAVAPDNRIVAGTKSGLLLFLTPQNWPPA